MLNRGTDCKSSWDDLASENERLIAPTDSFDRIVTDGMSDAAPRAASTASSSARHGNGASGSVPSRTRRWRMTRKSAGSGPALP
ncbi:MAG: hypothetical protein ACLQI7_19245 [Streptosporangiaceae bacterium]|jgi:hypothetical protein